MFSVAVTGLTSSILLVQVSESRLGAGDKSACKYESSVIQEEVVSCVSKCDVTLDQ